MKLSICMMVKNEEKNLGRCLESLKPLMESVESELIIVDTGSEDNTAEIAKNYTDKIYFHKWNNNFSEMRNISISYACGDWIFILDADEEIINVQLLISIFKNRKVEKYNTVTFKEKNFVSFQSDYYNEHVTPRIFRNDGTFKYVGSVHNAPVMKHPILNLNDYILNHYGYVVDDKDLMDQKFNRTTSLLKKELEYDPENIYYRYQLSASYALHNNKKDALEEIKKAYTIIKNKGLDASEYIYVYQQLIKCYIVNDMYNQSEEICKEGISVEKDFVDFYYYLGISEIMLEKYEEALEQFNKYFDLADIYNDSSISKNTLMVVYTLGSKIDAYYNMAFIYFKKNEFENCIKWLEKIKDKKYLQDKLQIILGAFCGLKDFKGLRDFLNENINNGENAELFYNTLETYVKNLDYDETLRFFLAFSQGEDNYSILNKIRLSYKKHEKFETKKLIEEFLFNLDLDVQPDFYGDLLYFSFALNVNIEQYENLISESKLGQYLTYAFKEYNDMAGLSIKYLMDKNKQTSNEFIKFKMILSRSVLLFNDKLNNTEYASLFKSYVNYGIRYITGVYKDDILLNELIYNLKNESEAFLSYIYLANKNEGTDGKKYIDYLKKALKIYPVLNKGVEIMLDEYKKKEANVNKEFEDYKNQVKSNISSLINAGDLENAKSIITEYENIVKYDVEICTMKAIVSIMSGNLNEAEIILKNGLELNSSNFDILYNLGYLYGLMNRLKDSVSFYERSLKFCNDENMKKEINDTIEKIKVEHYELIISKKKLAFLVKQGMDSFLGDIVESLSKEYDVEKVIVTELNQIDEAMNWADICWFEWCDELISYGSRNQLASEKTLICRLHSYEAFTSTPSSVNWNVIDKIIFVGEHIRHFAIEKFNIDKKRTIVIPNGININKYAFKERQAGFNIAYVGYINYKKGPMLLLQTFKEIYEHDNRYKLYIAGQFQDERDLLYFRQMIEELNLGRNVYYDGWQNNLNDWLEDKNFVLCTSLLESQNVSVMQAMAKGIKPVIHNFVGAKTIYDHKYIWNTINEAISILTDKKYNSKEYYEFIKNNYSTENELITLNELLKNTFIISPEKNNLREKPLVTVGITNYNGKQYLKECIESFLSQTYPNIEILLIDDCSNDGSKEIIQEYERNYKNIRGIFHSINSGGASKGIQEIIEGANGKYLQWIACDDFVEKNAIENFVNYLEENPDKDYVYSDFNIVNENSLKISEWKYKVFNPEQVVHHIFYTSAGIIPMNCLYRNDFFKKNNVKWIVYRDNDFSADTLNSLQFIKYNWQYGKIDKNLINYRIHSNNASHNLEKRIKTVVSVYDYIIKNFNVEVYLPQYDWKNVKNKEQLKNLLISNFYYEQIINHISTKAIPGYIKGEVTKESLIRYCSILDKEGKSYLEKGLMMGSDYKSQLYELKEKYKLYKK